MLIVYIIYINYFSLKQYYLSGTYHYLNRFLKWKKNYFFNPDLFLFPKIKLLNVIHAPYVLLSTLKWWTHSTIHQQHSEQSIYLKQNSLLYWKICYLDYLLAKMCKFNSALVSKFTNFLLFPLVLWIICNYYIVLYMLYWTFINFFFVVSTTKIINLYYLLSTNKIGTFVVCYCKPEAYCKCITMQ